MYDLLNEPNNVPQNQPIHDIFQRLITTIRGQGDNHLILVEGNGFGNDFNYMEPYTFSNKTNLVYNSHRYSGSGYEMDNGVNSTGGGPNSLRFLGNLQNFRTLYKVPIWIGETGENTAAWMGEAARNLNSIGIGWCHWTYKRFDSNSNAALMRIPPPYIVDGPAGLPQVLTNILFQNAIPNNSTINAISPAQLGLINYPDGGNYNGTALASRTATKAALSFYPNPVADAFTYQLPAGVLAHRLTVLDLAGRSVLTKVYGNTGRQNSLDVATLRSGLYIIRISSPTFNTEFKISKQ
jgi:endoglucanase